MTELSYNFFSNQWKIRNTRKEHIYRRRSMIFMRQILLCQRKASWNLTLPNTLQNI
ncbi:unnamed protein product [Schistosoma mattheei]|uniref:Uncharacterized protein n=1 Tax=Schistosoma mattheei TaxID=31246 RepID=A0A3P7Z0T3_9TREM|nr:unnamed protein product [Schistosoma mattheei]